MCDYCRWGDCHYGEICACERGLVKRYGKDGRGESGRDAKSASDVLGRPAEWEHVIPKEVLEQLVPVLQGEEAMYAKALMSDGGFVFALDKPAHRDEVSSTGNSRAARAFRECVAETVNKTGWDEAVFLLMNDEVRAINSIRGEVGADAATKFPSQYVPALGAVLNEYNRAGIISSKCVLNNYLTVRRELEGWTGH